VNKKTPSQAELDFAALLREQGCKLASMGEEIGRLRAALNQIAEHWGDPMPLSTPDRALVRKWREDYDALRAIARKALDS
jgi:hypothetical protein